MSTTWHARLDWAGDHTTPDDLAALLDQLSEHGPAGSINSDGLAGSVMIALEADSLDSAITAGLALGRAAAAQALSAVEITGIEVTDSDALDRGLAQPVFPAVVGYAEIAELAGVSRQRARAFSKIAGFPSPVIETAQGPLMARTAVEHWLATRNTRPGRRSAA